MFKAIYLGVAGAGSITAEATGNTFPADSLERWACTLLAALLTFYLVLGGFQHQKTIEVRTNVNDLQVRRLFPNTISSIIVGFLVYLNYQAVMFVFSFLSLFMLKRNITESELSIIPIAVPFVCLLFSIFWGAIISSKIHRPWRGVLISMLTFFVSAIFAQIIVISMGKTDHLAAFSAVPISQITQGLLLAWLVVSAGLPIGIVLDEIFRWCENKITS